MLGDVTVYGMSQFSPFIDVIMNKGLYKANYITYLLLQYDFIRHAYNCLCNDHYIVFAKISLISQT